MAAANSPSRTRTYDLAVNSRIQICASALSTTIYSHNYARSMRVMCINRHVRLLKGQSMKFQKPKFAMDMSKIDSILGVVHGRRVARFLSTRSFDYQCLARQTLACDGSWMPNMPQFQLEYQYEAKCDALCFCRRHCNNGRDNSKCKCQLQQMRISDPIQRNQNGNLESKKRARSTVRRRRWIRLSQPKAQLYCRLMSNHQAKLWGTATMEQAAQQCTNSRCIEP